jgi:hypothetical protein
MIECEYAKRTYQDINDDLDENCVVTELDLSYGTPQKVMQILQKVIDKGAAHHVCVVASGARFILTYS